MSENPPPVLGSRQRRQIVWITAGALGLYVLFRLLPTGTNLNHIDFRVQGGGSIEFCDPSNPQFIPVVAVRSPVSMTLAVNEPVQAGRVAQVSLVLNTASGKPIGPEDLIVAHTQKLHLLIVDPTLGDYQHIHPVPADKPGEWRFEFTPRSAGIYRVFADFTPVATARGLYANADLNVTGTNAVAPAAPGFAGHAFQLQPAELPLRAGKTADLAFTIARSDGAVVRLEPVMGAFAHLVAFDEMRSGFAHLHPNETDLTRPPDARQPRLTFKITIPKPGRYVIWAQVKIEGREFFTPFWFEVIP